MFHGAAKLLTLLSVLFHAGMGCCAHHDHCSILNSTPEVAEQQTSRDTHQCSCQFHAHSPTDAGEKTEDDKPDHSSCPCGEGHGGCSDHCSWLTNSKVELPTDDGVVLPLALADVGAMYAASDALIASGFLHGLPSMSGYTGMLRAKTQVWRL
ncbi:MAG: hypothetical protein ABJZ55_19040 [Fuerstiella sp.]